LKFCLNLILQPACILGDKEFPVCKSRARNNSLKANLRLYCASAGAFEFMFTAWQFAAVGASNKCAPPPSNCVNYFVPVRRGRRFKRTLIPDNLPALVDEGAKLVLGCGLSKITVS